MSQGRAVIAGLLFALAASAQETAIPFILGRGVTMIAPAVDAPGRSVVFGSSIAPDGTQFTAVDIYAVGADGAGLRRLTRLAAGTQPPQGAMTVALTPDGQWAAFTVLSSSGKGEEVHLMDVARASDKTVAVDTQGCIQPLTPGLDCPACFFACLQTPHAMPDGSAVLYAVRRQKPFYMAKTDGSPPQNLPTYSGALAAAPQRVVSRSGLVVFTSNAPSGPTFAPAPGDVYLMNLDGSNLRQVTKFSDPAVYAREATISADGRMIAFLANLDLVTSKGTNTTRLFTIAADGSSLRQIASGEVSSPSLSSDGTRLAFISGGDVFVGGSDGAAIRRLTQFQISRASAAVLSEDGSRVAFGVGPDSGSIGAIYVVNSDGTGLRAVYSPRSLNQNGVTGAVTGFGPVAAGSLASAYGTNFTADRISSATSLPLPDTLAGVFLTMNGVPLPLVAVSPWQINFQVPPEQNEGPVAFEASFSDGVRTAPVAQTVSAFGPAIFLLPSIRPSQAAALHSSTSTPVDPAHPAQAGEAIEIYSSGLGPTNPFVPAGTPAPARPPAVTLAQPEVTISGRAARVIFSGLAPGFVGVYQVNAIVPEGLRPGDNSLVIKVGNIASQGAVISTK